MPTYKTPEVRYPAELEDIDTIIAGSDGKDYVVDIIDGMKRWVPYLPEPDHVVTIEKILPKIDLPGASTQKEEGAKKQPTKYQLFVTEMIPRLKKEHPNMSGTERMELIRQMWKDPGSRPSKP
jgi:hypothetical protein